MNNYKYLNFFKDMNFEPMFFFKSAGEPVSFLEFKNFIETVDMEEYFNDSTKITTSIFYDIAFAYCLFFNSFYDKCEIFKKNYYWICYNVLSNRKYEEIIKTCLKSNISSKWLNIIKEFQKEPDNFQKIIFKKQIQQIFLNEFITFSLKWIPETELKSANKVKSITIKFDGTLNFMDDDIQYFLENIIKNRGNNE